MQSIDFQARRKRVAQHARELGFDAYLGTRQGALHYLSGAFMPWRGAVLVTADGHCEFIYWAMDASRVRAEGHEMEMYEFEFSDFPQLIRQRLEHQEVERASERVEQQRRDEHRKHDPDPAGPADAEQFLPAPGEQPDAGRKNDRAVDAGLPGP